MIDKENKGCRRENWKEAIHEEGSMLIKTKGYETVEWILRTMQRFPTEGKGLHSPMWMQGI